MFLLLSGEGPTDIGTSDEAVGPMSKFVDQWISRRSDYSLLESGTYKIISEHELASRSKELKSRSRRGKRTPVETAYYYRNARALARILHEESQTQDWNLEEMIPVLFRDTDNTASSGRGEWQDKWDSIINGFLAEEVETGVPMVPKPKSEAWLLCALRDKYQHCAALENESGNDNSPNSLKSQLEESLGEKVTRELLNDKIDQGEININRIEDMQSLNNFKDRLDEVLDALLPPLIQD
ncbi:MAG: hypothetical protein HQK61_03900 [Desulfamplus sp.]|nr:hypothetical protein [Desulfamplus sp.]